MTDVKNFGGWLVERLSSRAFQARKYLHQHFRRRECQEPKRILFIVGCQRSGTTLMQQIFERDLDARVFGEYSEISKSYQNLRLKPLETVKAIFDREPAPLIVAKPLAEAQNTLKLLAFFPGSKALFMYRNYMDVASSDLKQFGLKNGINNLRPIVLGEHNNWRTDGVPKEIRAMVAAKFSEDMDPYDAAALFWYVRNRIFFDLGLDQHPSVAPFRYEDLVTDPSGMIARVYRLVEMAAPAEGAALVHATSLGKGKNVRLSADVGVLCRDLLKRLDDTYCRNRDISHGSLSGHIADSAYRYHPGASRHRLTTGT